MHQYHVQKYRTFITKSEKIQAKKKDHSTVHCPCFLLFLAAETPPFLVAFFLGV